MKVCIFTGVISLDRDNTDVRKKYILERVKHFEGNNIFITLLTPASKNNKQLNYSNLSYHSFFSVNKKGFKMLCSIIFPFKKLIYLKCDVVHCLNYQSYIIAWFANIFRKNKYILLFEAMGLAYAESVVDSKSSLKVKILSPLIKHFEHFAFTKSDGVIVYTQNIKNFVIDHFNLDCKKVYVLPHGVDTKYEMLPSSSFLTTKIPSLSYDYIAMYVGSLSELHGTPYLMESMLELNSKRSDILFVILGDGVSKKKLESFIEKNELKNIVLTGFLPYDQIPLYMDRADVLLIPHSKCLQTELDPPTKLFEYLKAGKPIVSFKLGAIEEVVGDKAVLVEADNPYAFAEGIIEVIDNKDYYSRIAQQAKSIVDKFSWEASAEKQLCIYHSLIKID